MSRGAAMRAGKRRAGHRCRARCCIGREALDGSLRRRSSPTPCAAPPPNEATKIQALQQAGQRERNMASEVMSDARQRQELADELAKYGVRIAQPDDPPLFTKEPKSTMQPFHWKAADLARLLEKIGAVAEARTGRAASHAAPDQSRSALRHDADVLGVDPVHSSRRNRERASPCGDRAAVHHGRQRRRYHRRRRAIRHQRGRSGPDAELDLARSRAQGQPSR